MKKILIFGYSSMVGGVETYISNLLKYIDKNKFTIDMLVQEKIMGINADKLENNYNRIYIVENFKKHPLKAYKMLAKLYKQNNYDIIYMCLSTSSSILYALPAKKYNNNVKIVVHSHNGSDKKAFQHIIFRGILNNVADVKLACSKLAAEWMYGKKKIKKEQIIIINNAIETDRFLFNQDTREKIRKNLKIDNNQFLIGHVGRFSQQKNQIELIDIFSELLKINTEFMLLLIGDGELKSKVIEKCRQNKISDKVIILDSKSNIYEYYQAMDLFVMPSLFEGLPIVGIEAQTSGLDCIFSRNITKESNITGKIIFLELKDYKKWCEQICRIKDHYNILDRKNDIIIQSLIKSGYDLKNETRKIEYIFTFPENLNNIRFETYTNK